MSSGNQAVTRFAEISTPLSGNGVVAGGAHETADGYTRFRAFAASDVASAANGFVIQQSDDGATWFTTTTGAIAAGIASGTVLEALVVKRYVRAQVTNGAGAQTQFNFSTALVA